MDRQSKFLPDSVAGAVKSVTRRALGAGLVLFGAVAIVALMFHNPYLDGVATSSTFGAQTWLGNIVGFFRYCIGYLPTLFLFLCAVRGGISLLMSWQAQEHVPEYNFLRGFVAVFVGAIGLGLAFPGQTFGGLAGAIVSADLYSLIGMWCVPAGVIFVILFCVMAGFILNIRWGHVKELIRRVYRVLRWILSVFNLVQPVAEIEEEEAEEEEPVIEVARTRKRTVAKKRTSHSARARAVADGTHEYELPDPALLEYSNFGKNVVTPELKQNAKLMQEYFADYGVQGKVVDIQPGPIITLFKFMPERGVRISDISGTSNDMARAMATKSIRIATIPGTQLVGVEQANLSPSSVRFRELVEDTAFTESKYKIPLALGVGISGEPMYFDLAKMPHMLVAGRTGSGKSVFVQSLITSIVYHFTPDKCKLMIIDPKGVDFGCWDDIPHLITPIVKLDPVAAVNALKWAVREMEERYKQMQLLSARNIESYNEIAAQKRASGEKMTRQVVVGTDEVSGEMLFETQEIDLSDLPYIVIVVDEVAELMVQARKEVEACLQRIAQKARAAGIHLIMATQRPDATTITGVIKANFPTRVSFQARSVIDSMTTLGEKGAEQLLACGDMLFSEAGRPAVRVHSAFITDDELKSIGDFLRSQGEPQYASGVTDDEGDSANVGGGAIPGLPMSKDAKDADLYTQAKECVLRDKKPTISYIQRRLQIGYNKAAGFMERMEQEGVVSAPDINGKRHIL